MVAVIHTWRKNPLAEMREREPPEWRKEREALYRRLFVRQIVVEMYEGRPPYDWLCWEEFDELGQWGDDGGRCCD